MNMSLPAPQHCTRELLIRIPGEPVGQGRPRGFYRPGLGVRMYDPAKSRNWKATAQQHYVDAVTHALSAAPAFPEGPLELDVLAVFTLARSHWRKRDPVPRRPKTSKPDGSNVLKAVEDAGNGILWLDDTQLVVSRIARFIGAQGEAPFVEVRVRPWTEGGDAARGEGAASTIQADPGSPR